jgi:hypothetical protein
MTANTHEETRLKELKKIEGEIGEGGRESPGFSSKISPL